MKKEKSSDSQENFRKIMFRLEKDEDGYPPNEWETLWATENENGLYSIDNIPFYVRDISCGDVVSVKDENGRLYFDEVVSKSLNSVIRVIVYDELKVPKLRDDLEKMKCESEQSHVPNLIAVEVPENVSLDNVLTFLDDGEAQGLWEYETASLRQ